MRDSENISQVMTLQPNYMGFIFWEPSPRYVDLDTPALKAVKKTGVFVNASQSFIEEKIIQHKLNAVQLHGKESPDFCKQILNNEVEVIKAFSVNEDFNFSVLTPYETVCDFYLFDTKATLPGGTGLQFDWNLMKKYPSTKPFFISGGIGPNHVDSLLAFEKLNLPLYAVDVNSKFETAPGIKNIESLKMFKKELYAV